MNLRRIISGFLETAYEYSRNDSDVLAKYVTIYNAVVRADLDFFASRYKPRVMEFLTAEKVGLSLNYVEWPANSQIVIPLMPEAGPGELGSIDFRELIDERVIDRLREEEEMGLEERRSMVELIDRVVEEREAELQEQREELDAEQERADQEQAQEQEREPRDGAQEQPPARPEEEEPADADRQQETDPDVEADRDDQAQQPAGPQGDQAEEEDPAGDRTDLAEEEQELRELEEAARRERERIAQDTRLLLDEEGPEGVTLGDTEPVYFIEVSRAGSVIRGQLVQINPLTSAVLNRSPESNIITREYRLVSGRVLVIVEDGDVGRLALYDTTSLEQVAVGQEAIYQGSSLAVQGPEATIYAVFADDDQWYVGRFEADLTFRERSYLAVNPDTPLVFTEDQLWVQSRDGVILPLALADLTVDRR